MIFFPEIPPGKAELHISPQVVAYVEENNSLTFTCTATALQFSLVIWKTTGDLTDKTIVKNTCADFNNDTDLAIYQFSCSGNLFNWTILQVTKQQHGDEWFCRTNDLNGTESIKTRIFVKGNCFISSGVCVCVGGGGAGGGCGVTPLMVHPTLIVHVNNMCCDCNAYCSFCQVDNKRRLCRSEYSINR